MKQTESTMGEDLVGSRRIIDILSLFSALVYLLYIFLPPAEYADFIGYYNPIYMYLNYGRMTYPVHGIFDGMTVHPPTRFFFVALMMKAGVPFFYAMVAPQIFFSLLAALLIRRSPFNFHIKVSLLALVFLSYSLPYAYLIFNNMRPENLILLSFFCGLVAMESARLENWNSRLSLIGASCVMYSSTLHYYSAVNALTVVIYLIAYTHDAANGRYGFRAIANSVMTPRALSLYAPAILISATYALFFLIPQREGIANMINNVQGGGGLRHAIFHHQVLLSAEFPKISFASSLSAPYGIFAYFIGILLRHFYLPLFAFTIAVFMILKNEPTRFMVFASLPIQVFIFVYSQSRGFVYLYIEMLFFTFAMLVAAISLALAFGRMVDMSRRNISLIQYAFATGVLVLMLASVHNLGKLRFALMDILLMDAARAGAVSIVGDDAVVGANIDTWYTSGTSHWMSYVPLLPPLSAVNNGMAAPFKSFDAVADSFFSAQMMTVYGRAIPSTWYVAKRLNLIGLFSMGGIYAKQRGIAISDTCLEPHSVIYSVKNRPFKAVVYNPPNMLIFNRDSGGGHVMISFLMPGNRLNDLPDSAIAIQHVWVRGTALSMPADEVLVFAIVSNEQSKLIRKLVTPDKIVEEIPLRLAVESGKSFVNAHLTSRTITFHQTIKTLPPPKE